MGNQHLNTGIWAVFLVFYKFLFLEFFWHGLSFDPFENRDPDLFVHVFSFNPNPGDFDFLDINILTAFKTQTNPSDCPSQSRDAQRRHRKS